jgi:NADH dehydrogenase/NADH:ubiquinone oxidoreductase subunit G
MLTIVGQCRLCLVQLANRQGKLVAGCATHVEEGMDIITESETLTQNGTALSHRVTASPADANRTHHTVLSNLQLLRCRHPNACMTCEADGQYCPALLIRSGW